MELSHHSANFTAIQLLFMLLLIIITSSYLQPTMSKPHNNYTDLESLLDFKATVSDPNGLLNTNWTTNTSFCSWIGVYCNPRWQRVVGLRLENVFLHGTISPHLGNLFFLSTLHLANNNLTGQIPDALGQLSRLAELRLFLNGLSGQIPSTIFNMFSLKKLSVSSNNLTGPLPSNINLPRLWFISLSYNQLTGPIPPAFGFCFNLQIISFRYNQLSGKIPTSIGNLTNLSILDLSNARLEGVIPEELGNLLNLQKLNLAYNNLTGTIPTSLLNCTKLNFFQLAQNELTGHIPVSIGEAWPQLTFFNVAYNQLSGGLDFITSLTNCKNLNIMETSGNLIEEYGSTGKVSRKGDVYSFGILPLETFTRRRLSDAMFDEGLSLRKWVSDAFPDAVLKIVDSDLLSDDVITEQQPEDRTIIHQCLSSIIELGLMCSSQLPKERISMRDVVPKLQKIKENAYQSCRVLAEENN